MICLSGLRDLVVKLFCLREDVNPRQMFEDFSL